MITGAGNHSGDSGAKIKPMVRSWLAERRLPVAELNTGTFNVKL